MKNKKQKFWKLILMASGVVGLLILGSYLCVSFTSKVEAMELNRLDKYSYTPIGYKVKKIEGRTYIEEFYYRFENNIEFRNYILNMNLKRNNPGNLRCASQPHSTCVGGFASFPNSLIGFRALVKQLEVDYGRDLTLKEFINKYSPPHENDTASCYKFLKEKMGDGKIVNFDIINFAQAITQKEHSYK